VIAVVYSDRTAEVQSAKALERVLSVRKGTALARQESAEIINGTVRNSSEAHPSAAAADGVRRMLLRSRTEHTGELPTELLAIIDDLQRAPADALQLGISEREYLSRYATKAAQRRAHLLPHPALRIRTLTARLRLTAWRVPLYSLVSPPTSTGGLPTTASLATARAR
jgi:hypothetical protein